MSDFVKIRFRLEPDTAGWPPAESEGLWAEPLGRDLYRVDNTPWFVLMLAADDIVRAASGDDDVLWATERVEWSGKHTIRVIPRSSAGMTASQVRETFEPLRVTGEVLQQYRMVALDVPADAPLADVKALLRRGEREGWWDFEEACVGDPWLSL
jgi:xanthine dehydrogenase molybdopterin-binding subunit B